tara:strand:+ start:324 stop:539 length:216 start_codon:yes stop_codon:yes gene_type:complete
VWINGKRETKKTSIDREKLVKFMDQGIGQEVRAGALENPKWIFIYFIYPTSQYKYSFIYTLPCLPALKEII